MLKKTNTLQDEVMGFTILRRLFIGIIALIIAAAVQPSFIKGFFGRGSHLDQSVNAAAGIDAHINSGPISISARRSLEDALAQSVDSYINFSQTVGTAAYYSNSEALDLILRYDDVIEDAAAVYGVDKAVIQSILFQEIRFINFLDEVDLCVQNTYFLLHKRETWSDVSPLLTVSIFEFFMTGFYASDSSTGLGQIYAKSAVKAANWYIGAELYDYDDWKDREIIWLNLKYNDAFNINMIGLLCRYNAYILQSEKHLRSPSIRDILRIYNGSGPLAERYAAVTYQYFLAFSAYNDALDYQ